MSRFTHRKPAESPAKHAEAFVRFCIQCGYNLTGLTRDICPECGQAFNPDDPNTWSADPNPRRKRLVLGLLGTAVSLASATLLLIYLISHLDSIISIGYFFSIRRIHERFHRMFILVVLALVGYGLTRLSRVPSAPARVCAIVAMLAWTVVFLAKLIVQIS